MEKIPEGLELQPVDGAELEFVEPEVCKNCKAKTADVSREGLCPICASD